MTLRSSHPATDLFNAKHDADEPETNDLITTEPNGWSPAPAMKAASASPLTAPSPAPIMRAALASPLAAPSPAPAMQAALASPLAAPSPAPAMQAALASPLAAPSPAPAMQTALASPLATPSPAPTVQAALASPLAAAASPLLPEAPMDDVAQQHDFASDMRVSAPRMDSPFGSQPVTPLSFAGFGSTMARFPSVAGIQAHSEFQGFANNAGDCSASASLHTTVAWGPLLQARSILTYFLCFIGAASPIGLGPAAAPDVSFGAAVAGDADMASPVAAVSAMGTKSPAAPRIAQTAASPATAVAFMATSAKRVSITTPKGPRGHAPNRHIIPTPYRPKSAAPASAGEAPGAVTGVLSARKVRAVSSPVRSGNTSLKW